MGERKGEHETRVKRVEKRKRKSYIIFFFQAEDGIRDSSTSRGLGDVYKRQSLYHS
ncbi:hypothetical protein AMBR_NBBOBCOC_02830 [Lacticaseibacillus rhamnosus]|nr:hypothetical protein AMBR_NBBOBCOC_02830 [Lacticaseibacillus rhamnosus]